VAPPANLRPVGLASKVGSSDAGSAVEFLLQISPLEAGIDHPNGRPGRIPRQGGL